MLEKRSRKLASLSRRVASARLSRVALTHATKEKMAIVDVTINANPTSVP